LKFPEHSEAGNATGPTQRRSGRPVAYEFRDIDMHTTRRRDPVIERRLAERRFLELANAVREHEATLGRQQHRWRREDKRLYQRLRQIGGEPALDAEPARG
jgi:hypothetical protein